MATLIYTAIASLDGYVNDESGNFDWAAPDEEVHAFVNDLERPIGTYLYGRKLYETMVAWETMDLDEQPSVIRDYAEIWRAADKVVFSKTLEKPASRRTRIERVLDPVSIGGPHLAAEAIRAGLVDEYRFFLAPVVIGGGTASLPDNVRLDLELIDERRFDSGFVHLHYRRSVRG
ncbi:MAG: deaminase [Actinobacteria bacterium]|nr:MAG: deaminase [Actinomycetota bacterium]